LAMQVEDRTLRDALHLRPFWQGQTSSDAFDQAPLARTSSGAFYERLGAVIGSATLSALGRAHGEILEHGASTAAAFQSARMCAAAVDIDALNGDDPALRLARRIERARVYDTEC
jgi:hypothetical protein